MNMEAKRKPQADLLEGLNGSPQAFLELKPGGSGLGKGRGLKREGGPQPVPAVSEGSNGHRTEQKLAQYEEQLQILASGLSLAEERERRRISLVLHDQIGQTLAIARLRLGQLRDLESTDGVDRPLKEIRSLIDQAIGATRSLTFELSPPVLYELGLEAALQSLGERLGRREGIRFHFECDQEPKPLADDKSVVLYRGGRELLYNIVKHAQAHNAWMRVARDEDCIRITVEDDGVGFDACQAAESFTAGGGFGLFSMARQLDHIGGKFEMEPSPGQGTRVVVSAPLDLQEKGVEESKSRRDEETKSGRVEKWKSQRVPPIPRGLL